MDGLGELFMDWLFLAVWLAVTLCVLLLLFLRRASNTEAKQEQQLLKMQDQWRKERNRRAEAVMAGELKALGWPQLAERMTPEEVAHQLCIRLAEKLWNRPDVD